MKPTRTCIVFPLAFVCIWTGILFGETTVGELVDVAAEVEETQFQKWPRAAWSPEAKCWLVVWREGDYNKQNTDIWCARVAEDGTAMDPAGIRITTAKDLQDKPVVASDGKDFLVVWQDLRSGKDWDVYAARVSAEGKVSEPDGFLVSGGANNQCLPTIVYAADNYVLAWQFWVEDGAAPGFGSYGVRGARVSRGGKLLDPDGVDMIGATAIQPTLAYHKEGGLVLVCIGRTEKKISFSGGFKNFPVFLRFDPATGVPQGEPTYMTRKEGYGKTWDKNYPPGVALMKDGTSLVNVVGDKGGMTLFRYDKAGKRIGEWQRFRKDSKNSCIVTVPAMATDGEKILMTYDFPTKHESLVKARGRVCMRVWGWMLSPDGTILEGGKSGFPIASKDDMDSVQGFPCAGPSGTFLVVYSEMRADKNTKVVGRLVK